MSSPKHLSIVILNYRTADDAIAAARSVVTAFSGDTQIKANVIIIDNDSQDNSESKLSEFAALESSELEITFIQSGHNGGYAAGNNIGLKKAFDEDGVDFALILNADARIALSDVHALVGELQNDADIYGCPIRYKDGYQCYGGAYINAKFMITRPVLDPAYVGKMIIDPLFYLSGAFLLIPRDFYDKVGPISEEYFLYFEEADWFQRARTKYGRDVNAFVLSSIEIDHAIGGSTGNSETRQSKSSLAVFYSARSRMYFSRKWNTVWIAGAFFSNCAIAMHQMVHGRWENALAALRGAVVGAFFQRH